MRPDRAELVRQAETGFLRARIEHLEKLALEQVMAIIALAAERDHLKRVNGDLRTTLERR